MQVVPILYTVWDRSIPEEMFKPLSHSTQCTSDVSRTRPPSSWTGVRAARRRVGVGRGYALPSHCAIHETSYTIQVLSLHAISCISVSSPSVTRAALYVPSPRARPEVFFLPEEVASGKRLHTVLGKVCLHSWCLIVVQHGDKARPLRRLVADEHPLYQKRVFQGLFD